MVIDWPLLLSVKEPNSVGRDLFLSLSVEQVAVGHEVAPLPEDAAIQWMIWIVENFNL